MKPSTSCLAMLLAAVCLPATAALPSQAKAEAEFKTYFEGLGKRWKEPSLNASPQGAGLVYFKTVSEVVPGPTKPRFYHKAIPEELRLYDTDPAGETWFCEINYRIVMRRTAFCKTRAEADKAPFTQRTEQTVKEFHVRTPNGRKPWRMLVSRHNSLPTAGKPAPKPTPPNGAKPSGKKP